MIRIANTNATPDDLYSGRELDGNLQFYHTRHYDPTVGRFISEEPVGCEVDAVLYRYAANEPKE